MALTTLLPSAHAQSLGDLRDVLFMSTVSLSAGALQGEDVTGWTLGLSASF